MKTTRIILIIISIVLFQIAAFTQVAINTDGSSADASAILDLKSTDQGILVPRMTESQRDAISNPATGLMIFQTDGSSGFYFYNGASWDVLMNESSSGGSTNVSNSSFRFGFASSSTWECPDGVTTITVQLWGGAGGGGGSDYTLYYGYSGDGGHGGDGGYIKSNINVIPGESYEIIIGAGGSKGILGRQSSSGLIHATDGEDGGQSSFGGALIAEEGTGGEASYFVYMSNSVDGDDGIDGQIVNYSIEYVTVASTTSDRPYVPEGFIRSSIKVESHANGGSGGSGAHDNDGYSPGNMGVDGVSGYCIISY